MASPFLETQQQEQAPTQPAPDQFASAQSVAGNPQDDLRRAEAMDPTEVEQPTDDEQQQYDDFVSRALSLIADNRKPEDGGPSPSEATLELMNNSSFSVPEALAEGAANTVMIVHNAAKRADRPYSPDVLFHGSDEVIAGLYLLGAAAGIFKDAPSHEWAAQGDEPAPDQAMPDPAAAAMPPSPDQAPLADAAPPGGEAPAAPTDADFTDEEYMLMGEAKILATEKFGRKLQESGQLTKKEQAEAQEFWKSQIAKEVETGQVDDSVMDRVDVDALRKQISQGNV